MRTTWDECAEKLRKEYYRLNMELPHWEARGDSEMVGEIKGLLAEIKRSLETETRH